MILCDSNVLLDVLVDDPRWAAWSLAQLETWARRGPVIVNPVIYAELAAGYGTVEALDPGDRGAGDIAFISGIIPGLDGLGIGGGQNSHAKGESASVENLAALTKRAALLIYRLTR